MELNVRVGSQEVSLLFLAFDPELEWSLGEVNTGDSLGDDFGAKSLAVHQ